MAASASKETSSTSSTRTSRKGRERRRSQLKTLRSQRRPIAASKTNDTHPMRDAATSNFVLAQGENVHAMRCLRLADRNIALRTSAPKQRWTQTQFECKKRTLLCSSVLVSSAFRRRWKVWTSVRVVCLVWSFTFEEAQRRLVAEKNNCCVCLLAS